MLRIDAIEAQPILNATLDAILSFTATRGRAGADLRASVGDIKATARRLLQDDILADPLIECFELARVAGITLAQLEQVRKLTSAQPAVSVGAIMTKDTLIELALATQGRIIAVTTFVSRQDVVDVKSMLSVSFAEIEEGVADQMDSTTYRALITLHAAITSHLVETARPLPRMISFQFNTIMSTLLLSHRLYADARRADELRRENRVVHPAFAPRIGRALSA